MRGARTTSPGVRSSVCSSLRPWRWALEAVLPLAVSLGLLACGAGAGEGGGAENLPTRGVGPYGKLEDDPDTFVDEPVVLSDPDGLASWRAPCAVSGPVHGRYTVYFAAEVMKPSPGPTALFVARDVSLADGPGSVEPVLAAERSWEGTRLDHPQLIVPGLDAPYGLLYEAGEGVIGYAESEDGLQFTRASDEPLLAPDPSRAPEEGSRVGSPAAVWTSPGRLLLLYEAPDAPGALGALGGGAIFGAALEVSPDLPVGAPGHLTLSRLDADPRSPERDPVLGPDPFLDTFDEAAVSSPWLQTSQIADRLVYDLFYSGRDAGGDVTVGFAGSHDGLFFQRFDKNPILPRNNALERDPSVVLHGTWAVMFYTEVRVARLQTIGAARYP